MNIKVIIGSTRKNRFGDKPAAWIAEEFKKQKDVEVEVLDLRDYTLPFFDEPISPAMSKEPFTNPEVVKSAKKLQKQMHLLLSLQNIIMDTQQFLKMHWTMCTKSGTTSRLLLSAMAVWPQVHGQCNNSNK